MKKTILKKIIAFIFITFLFTAYAEPWQGIKVKPAENTIALTFDDGPSPEYTPKILEILKENHINATFFVEGQFAKRYPELIKQIYANGNVIANHTMNHLMLTRLNSKSMQTEISGTNEIIEKILGFQPKCLRPPYGKHNKSIDDYAHSLNMAVLNWDLNSFDYERPGTQKLIAWVLKNTYNRYVILLHDGGGNRSQTVAALPAIIKGLQEKGFGFETICN